MEAEKIQTGSKRTLADDDGEDKVFANAGNPIAKEELAKYLTDGNKIAICDGEGNFYEFEVDPEYAEALRLFLKSKQNNWRKMHGIPMMRRGFGLERRKHGNRN